MGIVLIHDRNQPPRTLLPKCSHGLVNRVFVQFTPLDGPAADGTVKTDRYCADDGTFGTEGIPQTFGTNRFRLDVNKEPNNKNPNWSEASVVSENLEHEGVDIPLRWLGGGDPQPPNPGPITGYGSCDEWRSAVFAIFSRHGYNSVGPDNEGQGANQAPHLRATIADIKALHPSAFVQWQYESVGNPPELRPRLFLPHGGTNPFARYADLGDWLSPLKWEHCVSATSAANVPGTTVADYEAHVTALRRSPKAQPTETGETDETPAAAKTAAKTAAPAKAKTKPGKPGKKK